jgi:methionyl-tRNA formyltransferase
MTQEKFTILQMAYGEMAFPVLDGLSSDPRFKVLAIVTPESDDSLYRTEEKLPQESLAEDRGIEIIRTGNLKTLHDEVARVGANAVVIASFNKIIPEKTLGLSRFTNIHLGELPRQRGRANVNWAMINKEPYICVSIHEAVPDLDAGDIIHQIKVPIEADDGVGAVYERINAALGMEFPDLYFDYLSGKISPEPQDGSGATYYGTRLPQDGLIDWRNDRKSIETTIRALGKPYRGAHTYLDGRKLIIWGAHIENDARVFEGGVPGRIASHEKGVGVEVLTGDGPLLLTDVETDDFQGDPAAIIRSSRVTLGLNPEDLLKKINDLELKIESLLEDRPS